MNENTSDGKTMKDGGRLKAKWQKRQRWHFSFGLKRTIYTRIDQVWENANDATRMKLYFIIFCFLRMDHNVLLFTVDFFYRALLGASVECECVCACRIIEHGICLPDVYSVHTPRQNAAHKLKYICSIEECFQQFCWTASMNLMAHQMRVR